MNAAALERERKSAPHLRQWRAKQVPSAGSISKARIVRCAVSCSARWACATPGIVSHIQDCDRGSL